MKRLGLLSTLVTVLAMIFSGLGLASSRPSHPEQQESPSPSPTPSPTESQTFHGDPCWAFNACRYVYLETSNDMARYGTKIFLRGEVAPYPEECPSSEHVTLNRQFLGSEPEVMGTTVLSPDGSFIISVGAVENANYWVSLSEHSPACHSATSNPVVVEVRVVIGFGVTLPGPKQGSRFRLTTIVMPCHPGTDIELFSARRGELSMDSSKTLDDDCRVAFVRRLSHNRVFQARWAKQDDDHESGHSRRIFVKVRR